MESRNELNEKIEERTLQWEEEKLKLLNEREKYLDKEYEIRSKLSFKKVEPDFEYENAPEYLEHLKEGLKLTIIQEKLNIMTEKIRIYNDRDERALLKKEKEKREGGEL